MGKLKIFNFWRKDAETVMHTKMTDHLARVQLVTKSLNRAVTAWREDNFEDLDREVGYMSAQENAADKLLAEMWLELTKGNLQSKLRSNILTFIKRADEIANYSKKAGNNALILFKMEFTEHVFDEIGKTCELISMATDKLVEALEIYRKNVQQTIDITTEISFLEHQVDGLYSRLKNHYFDYQKHNDNFGGLVIFDHAMRDLENAANSIEDASDVLRSIVISEI
jgi:predicted phosphate transport protein (TIGR00153 family)